MVERWTGLAAVIKDINGSSDPSAALASCMMIMLAKIKFDSAEMSDAVADGVLTYESFTEQERARIVEEFDKHLASLRN